MALRGSVLTSERAAPVRALDRSDGSPDGSSGVPFGALPLVLVTVMAAVVWGTAWGPLGVGIAGVLAIGAVAAWVDLRRGRLPDVVVLAGGTVGVATAVVASVQHGPSAAGAAAAGCAAVCVPLLAVHLASPDAMGFGDVKLGAVLGVVAGLLGWRWAVLALAVASGITVIAAAATRRWAVPFGPGLVAGAATSTVFAWLATIADAGPLGWEVATWR